MGHRPGFETSLKASFQHDWTSGHALRLNSRTDRGPACILSKLLQATTLTNKSTLMSVGC